MKRETEIVDCGFCQGRGMINIPFPYGSKDKCPFCLDGKVRKLKLKEENEIDTKKV